VSPGKKLLSSMGGRASTMKEMPVNEIYKMMRLNKQMSKLISKPELPGLIASHQNFPGDVQTFEELQTLQFEKLLTQLLEKSNESFSNVTEVMSQAPRDFGKHLERTGNYRDKWDTFNVNIDREPKERAKTTLNFLIVEFETWRWIQKTEHKIQEFDQDIFLFAELQSIYKEGLARKYDTNKKSEKACHRLKIKIEKTLAIEAYKQDSWRGTPRTWWNLKGRKIHGDVWPSVTDDDLYPVLDIHSESIRAKLTKFGKSQEQIEEDIKELESKLSEEELSSGMGVELKLLQTLLVMNLVKQGWEFSFIDEPKKITMSKKGEYKQTFIFSGTMTQDKWDAFKVELVESLLDSTFPDKGTIATNEAFEGLKNKYTALEWKDEKWTWTPDDTFELLRTLQGIL
jgi:hypothetical protein